MRYVVSRQSGASSRYRMRTSFTKGEPGETSKNLAITPAARTIQASTVRVSALPPLCSIILV